MSTEWLDTTIGAVCSKVFSGGTPTSTNPAYYGGTIPWLRTKEVNYGKVLDTEQHITQIGLENSSAKLVPVNSVIVAMYGNGDTAGRVAINKIPLTTNQACCNLVIDPAKADFRFVYYYLMGRYQELVDLKNGGAQQNLNGQLIKAFPFFAPNAREQSAIADVFESLDDRITLLRETNATLEAIAQALFKSWFIDFDPVRAKMEGRAPEGMDEAIARLFPDSFEESELGLVPKGWRVQSVYTVSTLIYGAPFASKQFNSNRDGAPLIRIRDLRDEAPGIFTPEVHPKGYMVQPGDIVVGMDGEFRAYLWGGEPAWLNQRVCVFAPKAGCPAAFVHRAIMPLLAAVEASETATTVIHLGKNDIDRFKILVPDVRVLASFGKLTDGLYSKIVNGKQSARTLATLRDTLLPRLISGQLRLPEAQAAAEEELA